ncbi:hypothetical protein ACFY84_29870 [Streptomyces sp. NPDC012438]|uniref:hypothetical protein n=1 Tax=Streptomyces sp. NPDC012438 TaxID=3364833 RepID=UPI0036E39AD6
MEHRTDSLTTDASRPAPRAVEAVLGARRAHTRQQFIAVVARQLHEIAPGTVRVRIVPVTVDDRPRLWVELVAVTGQVVSTSADQCRQARNFLRRAFPDADWTRPRSYNAATGALTFDSLSVPAELGIETAPAVAS